MLSIYTQALLQETEPQGTTDQGRVAKWSDLKTFSSISLEACVVLLIPPFLVLLLTDTCSVDNQFVHLFMGPTDIYYQLCNCVLPPVRI